MMDEDAVSGTQLELEMAYQLEIAQKKIASLEREKAGFATLARNTEETVDNVRAALSLESTHWLIIADQVSEVVKERDALKAENAELKQALRDIIKHCYGWEITCECGTTACAGCEYSVKTAKEALD